MNFPPLGVRGARTCSTARSCLSLEGSAMISSCGRGPSEGCIPQWYAPGQEVREFLGSRQIPVVLDDEFQDVQHAPGVRLWRYVVHGR